MPLPKAVLAKYKNDVFVETGTLYGEAIRMALDAGFKHVYSIDIDSIRISSLRPAMAGSPVSLYSGSSADILPAILPEIAGRITFWLDAHPAGNVLTLENTPVKGELAAIEAYMSRTPVDQYPTIMLDDMRLFTQEARDYIVGRLGCWPGLVSYEDTHIASADIMVYKPGTLV